MRIKMKLLPNFALLGVLLVSCASYKDIKEMDVFHRMDVDGVSADFLSACVKDLLQENGSGYIYHRNFDKFRNRWFLMAEYRTMYGGGNGYFSNSLSFLDTEGTVAVEFRALKTIWGTPQMAQEDVINFINSCAET